MYFSVYQHLYCSRISNLEEYTNNPSSMEHFPDRWSDSKAQMTRAHKTGFRDP